MFFYLPLPIAKESLGILGRSRAFIPYRLAINKICVLVTFKESIFSSSLVSSNIRYSFTALFIGQVDLCKIPPDLK